jgi:hypothetical protein
MMECHEETTRLVPRAKQATTYHVLDWHEILMVDASWDNTKTTGAGVVWFDKDRNIKEI